MKLPVVIAGSRISTRVRVAIGLAIAGLLLVPVAARAAERLFVQIPGFGGDATLRGFEGQIEARAVSVSASAAAGKPILAPVVITKGLDRSSPVLFDAFAKGKLIPSMVVTGTVNIATVSQPAQRYTLTNVRVVDYRVLDSSSNGTSTEQISFAAGGLTIDSIQYDSSGRPTGTVSGSIVSP